MAFVQAFVAMISSVNLLYILLHSWDEGSLMRQLLWEDHILHLFEGVSIRFLDALLCSCRWRLVLHGEARPNLAVRRHVRAILLHLLRHVLAQILPRWHPDRGSRREPTLHVGGLCVVLVS